MHGFYKNLRSKVLLTRFVLLLFHVAWTFFYHHICKSILQFIISDFFTEFPFHSSLCNTDGSQESLIQSLKKISISNDEIFSCKDNCSLMWKVMLFFSSTILKYWWDLFSLEILKTERVTSLTDAIGGWYIYRQPTIVVFHASLYRQPLLKFFRDSNYW